MAGDAEVTDKLLKGHTIGDMTYKVHLDGYNLVPYLTGEAEKSPRVSFIYCNDDQQVVGLRYDNWKIVFAEQREPGTMRVWAEPFVTLRVPKIFNLRTDPFERADITSIHLLRLAYRSRLPAGAGAGLYRRIPADLQGVSAAPEGRELQPRRRAPQATGEHPHVTRPNRIGGRRPGLRRPPSSVARGRRGQTHMARQETRTPVPSDPADEVRAFYESHPYPAPIVNLDRHRDLYRNPDRRRALSLLLWPTETPRANREILVAGCGTSQAAIHALREPDARVTAIDISETSLRYTRDLQQKYRLAKSRSPSARDRAGRGARPAYSTRSSAPACSTTCPIRILAFGHCAMSLRLAARCI